jgi:hypothetical protein
MKKTVFLSLIIALIIGGCTQQVSKLPQGAWQFVKSQRVINDSVVNMFPGKYSGSDIKMWSEEHFLVVGRFKMDTAFMDNYVGGTYKLEGNKYEESILYHVNKNAVGLTVKMLLELKNDTLIQTYPVDDNGIPVKGGYYIEKYIRLK